MDPQPFQIHLDQAVLDDLKVRLARSRPPPPIEAKSWESGPDPDWMRGLIDYWRDGFDWRAQEAALNRFAHFRAEVDGTDIHYIREPGRGERPLPILLTHGFPDSFARFLKLIPLLTDPEAHGGEAADAFEVIVPSLPGYGFSGPPADGGIFKVADLWHGLMTQVLGFRRYGAHGGDWGSTVTEGLMRQHAGDLVGIHLTDVPFWHAFRKPGKLTAAEARYFEAIEDFQTKGQGAYAMIQGARPLALADGLNDSPLGLAAWIVEKFERWSDCGGAVERAFSKDELLTNVTIYWGTQTIGSSFQPYADLMQAGPLHWIGEVAREKLGAADTPTGFAMFPKDLSHPPREWAERFFNVQRWTDMPHGGHFAAMEAPDLLAGDIRAFFRPLRHPQ